MSSDCRKSSSKSPRAALERAEGAVSLLLW